MNLMKDLFVFLCEVTISFKSLKKIKVQVVMFSANGVVLEMKKLEETS